MKIDVRPTSAPGPIFFLAFLKKMTILDSREAPYSGPFCEEKQRPGVQSDALCPSLLRIEIFNQL